MTPKDCGCTDSVLAIDPDGKTGFKAVTPANVISLLRGPDKVGSTVKLQIKSSATQETNDFLLKRADFRAVEKIKDVFMKLAELGTAAKAPKPDVIQKIAKELEGLVGALNDWTSMVEDHLQDHVQDLEDLVVSNLNEVQTLQEAARESKLRHEEEIQQLKRTAEEQQREADKALAEVKEALAKVCLLCRSCLFECPRQNAKFIKVALFATRALGSF